MLNFDVCRSLVLVCAGGCRYATDLRFLNPSGWHNNHVWALSLFLPGIISAVDEYVRTQPANCSPQELAHGFLTQNSLTFQHLIFVLFLQVRPNCRSCANRFHNQFKSSDWSELKRIFAEELPDLNFSDFPVWDPNICNT